MTLKQGSLITLLAFTLAPLSCYAQYRPIASLGIGGDSVKEHLNQNITITSPYQNTYTSGGNNNQLVGGLFLGVETNLYRDYLGQFGLGYYQNRAFNMSGSVYQFADSSLNNLSYHYQLSSQRFLVETKWLATLKKRFHPFITLGAGEAINQAYQYQEVPVSSADVPMGQGFNNRTHHAFTYEVGFGLDADIDAHFRAGLGYRFIDLGKAGLGTTPLQESNQTIEYNHLYVNELLLQLTYKA